jgi:hypothetical protein
LFLPSYDSPPTQRDIDRQYAQSASLFGLAPDGSRLPPPPQRSPAPSAPSPPTTPTPGRASPGGGRGPLPD